MSGPFRLPADMREGDWVELGQLGAYGACLRTQFNGFGRDLIEVATRRCWRPRATIDAAARFATPSVSVLFSERIFTKRRKS